MGKIGLFDSFFYVYFTHSQQVTFFQFSKPSNIKTINLSFSYVGFRSKVFLLMPILEAN